MQEKAGEVRGSAKTKTSGKRLWASIGGEVKKTRKRTRGEAGPDVRGGETT